MLHPVGHPADSSPTAHAGCVSVGPNREDGAAKSQADAPTGGVGVNTTGIVS